MSCFTTEQENVIKCIHFVTKLGKTRDSFEKELSDLYFKQGASYSTKLSYAFYQHYILGQTYMTQELYDAVCMEILKIYDELFAGKEEDWFIECLKVMFYEQNYDGLHGIEACMLSLERMKELQNGDANSIPEYIITYILQAVFLYKKKEMKEAIKVLEEGLKICIKGKIRSTLFVHFRGIIERFLYQTRCCREDELTILLEKINNYYF
ncbi:hypothetical protein DW638_07140 [Tyzzerella nexilis]|nr:hypothetical protein DW638_07140 [[Clostridium] nexile]